MKIHEECKKKAQYWEKGKEKEEKENKFQRGNNENLCLGCAPVN